MRLKQEFFTRESVTTIAAELIGKILITRIKEDIVKARIVETEAYSWKEKGCHAFAGNKTKRNSVMFEDGGCSYVYLCYGIHHLFNIVTNTKNHAEAVLIRAVDPIAGLDLMRRRRGKVRNDFQLTSGPGKLTKAMGIDRTFNGKPVTKDEIWVEDDGYFVADERISRGKRIGIDYAGEDAWLPWRFWLKDNKWVSV